MATQREKIKKPSQTEHLRTSFAQKLKQAGSKIDFTKALCQKSNESDNCEATSSLVSKSSPLRRYIYGNHLEIRHCISFSKSLYRAIEYSVKHLKGPSDSELEQKKVTLYEPTGLKKKFLFLDLDETLVHVLPPGHIQGDIELLINGQNRKINIRPYCFEFLQKMSEFYTIYLFTAATLSYAEPIVDYLNKNSRFIEQILHRDNCLQTNYGFFIKDLRIVKNRALNEMILVDNLAHSFGLQLQNGIPILDFKNDRNDCELQGIGKLLEKANKQQDIRHFLKENLGLRQSLKISEKDFLVLHEKENI